MCSDFLGVKIGAETLSENIFNMERLKAKSCDLPNIIVVGSPKNYYKPHFA